MTNQNLVSNIKIEPKPLRVKVFSGEKIVKAQKNSILKNNIWNINPKNLFFLGCIPYQPLSNTKRLTLMIVTFSIIILQVETNGALINSSLVGASNEKKSACKTRMPNIARMRSNSILESRFMYF